MAGKKLIGGIYRPLTPEQVDRIHQASLDILEQIGLSYTPDQGEVVDILASAGVGVDTRERRLRFGRRLVAESLACAPQSLILYSRDGQNDVELAGDQVHFGNGGTTTTILDLENGLARPSVLDDLFQIARLVERLKNVDVFIRPVTPTELAPDRYDVNICYAALQGTRKHVLMGIFDHSQTNEVIDLAALLAGGLDRLQARPFISIYTSYGLSPLQQSYGPTQILYSAVMKRIPISISSAPMSGMTAPITLAGTLTLTHAEVMSGLVMAQIFNPGAPVMYGGLPSKADMHSSNFAGGAIEAGMMNAAIHQLAKHIGIPNASSCGMSDSKLPDSQASWESSSLVLAAALGGTNLIRHAAAGILEHVLSISLEQMVMNDEMIGRTRRLLEGIAVDDEHIGLETIHQVGPGGTFLTTPQTMKHMRTEHYLGNGITNRQSRGQWTEGGSKDARERAREMVKKLLAQPDQNKIPADVDRAIRGRFPIQLNF